MFSTDCIEAAVEGILKKGNTEQALLVSGLYRFNADNNFNTRDVYIGISFLICAPNAYVSVAASIHELHFNGIQTSMIPDMEWYLQSQHDSCWRTDGFVLPSAIDEAVLRTNTRPNDWVSKQLEKYAGSYLVDTENYGKSQVTIRKMSLVDIKDILDTKVIDIHHNRDMLSRMKTN